MDAKSIKRQLGNRRIAARVGVTESAVGNCKDTFPPGWYPHIKALCDEAAVECPLSAFGWTNLNGASEPTGDAA